MKLDAINIQSFHSAVLTADTSVTPYPINWHPDHWLVVARCISGYILIYPSSQKGSMSFRVDRGSVIIPTNADTLTIETVGVTGFYDLYPVRNLDELDIKS